MKRAYSCCWYFCATSQGRHKKTLKLFYTKWHLHACCTFENSLMFYTQGLSSHNHWAAVQASSQYHRIHRRLFPHGPKDWWAVWNWVAECTPSNQRCCNAPRPRKWGKFQFSQKVAFAYAKLKCLFLDLNWLCWVNMKTLRTAQQTVYCEELSGRMCASQPTLL